MSSSYRFISTHPIDRDERGVFDTAHDVSSLGDITGDGVADLLIGARFAPGRDPVAGEAYVLSGAQLAAADAADGETDFVIDIQNAALVPDSYRFLGVESEDQTGRYVASAGDVDGDGLNDLLISATWAGGKEEGSVYLISAADLSAADAADGTTDGLVDLAFIHTLPGSYRIAGSFRNDMIHRAASAGDVDGDGLADILVSDIFHGGKNKDFFYWAFDSTTFLLAAADLDAADAADGRMNGIIRTENISPQPSSFAFKGNLDFRGLGSTISSAGDINGDGKSDVLIGADSVNDFRKQGYGENYVIGSDDLVALDNLSEDGDGIIDVQHIQMGPSSYRFIGTAGADRLGETLANLGDVDGDGTPDFLFGAPLSWGDDRGEVFLASGRDLAAADKADGTEDGVSTTDNLVAQPGSYRIMGSEKGDEVGTASASAGDVDGDGRPDILIGARGIEGNNQGLGAAYLLAAADIAAADAADGTVDGTIRPPFIAGHSASYAFISSSNHDHVGSKLASAGDVDGDGLADIVIGVEGLLSSPLTPGGSYLIAAADLAELDALDGAVDHVIDLDKLSEQTASPAEDLTFRDVVAFFGLDEFVFDGGNVRDRLRAFVETNGLDASFERLLNRAGVDSIDAAMTGLGIERDEARDMIDDMTRADFEEFASLLGVEAPDLRIALGQIGALDYFGI